MDLLKRYGAFISIIFLNLFLVIVWFHKGTLLGTGESSLGFYNLIDQFNRLQHAWSPNFLGNYQGYNLSDYFIYSLFAIIQQLGIPTFIIQAFFFLILLNCIFFSFYVLMEEFFKERKLSFIASLFYTFNLFTLVNVWGRFQYTFMYFYAFMPLGLYLFSKGLRKRKYSYAIVLALSSLLFAELFASIPHFLLFFSVIGLYIIFETIQQKKNVLFNISYLVVFIFLFAVVQSFWIIPFLMSLLSASYLTTHIYSSSGDLTTFQILSQDLGNLSFVLRLMSRSFFYNKMATWGGIYFNPIFIIISYGTTFFVLCSLFSKTYIKQAKFFVLLAMISIFFAKGDNQPFSFISDYLFTHFRVFEAFRNPFEKIGFLLPLAFAPLFSISFISCMAKLNNLLSNKLSNIILGLLGIIFFILLPFPIWNGWIVSKTIYKPYPNITKQVKVPDYYERANDWLLKNDKDYRTIAFPLAGEGMSYDWKYGYSGVELSNTIFQNPFISINPGTAYASSIVPLLEPLLIQHKQDFWKAASLLGANRVMIRHDVNAELEQLRPIKLFDDLFTTGVNNFYKDQTFGELSFYKLNFSNSLPRVYAASSVIVTSGSDSFIPFLPISKYEKGTIFADTSSMNVGNNNKNNIKQFLVKGKRVEYRGLKVTNVLAPVIIPKALFLPDSPLYILASTKDKIEEALTSQSSLLDLYITNSGKRIFEVYKMFNSQKYKKISKTLDRYDNNLATIGLYQELENSSHYEILESEKEILREIMPNLPEDLHTRAQKSYKKLIDILISLGVESRYNHDLNTTYKFTITSPGAYRLYVPTYNFQNISNIQNAEVPAFLDDKKSVLSLLKKNDFFDFGTFYLSAGNHEISFLIPESFNNVINQSSEVSYQVESGKEVIFPIKDFDASSTYDVSFEYYLEKGEPVLFEFQQDTDPINDNGKKEAGYSDLIGIHDYNNGWDSYSTEIKPKRSRSVEARLKLTIKPFNNCEDQKSKGIIILTLESCKNNNYKKLFTKPTVFHIKNLIIKRKPSYDIFFVSQFVDQSTKDIPDISYNKIDSAHYKILVRNAIKPYYLVFSDSFDQHWNAVAVTGNKKEVISNNNHFVANSFANTWYINKQGNYSLNLDYGPDEVYTKMRVITIGIILFLTASVFYLRKKSL